MTAGEARDAARKILGASEILAASGQSTANLDVSILLAHTLGVERSRLVAHPEIELGEREADFFASIEKRAHGLPVAYITGTKEFWGLKFFVTPAVLIPKPDTEILVERALEILRELEARRTAQNIVGEPAAHAETGNIATEVARLPHANAPLATSTEANPSHEKIRPAPADRAGTSIDPRPSPSPERRPIRVLDVCTGSGCIAVALKREYPNLEMTATDISPDALAVARKNAEVLLAGKSSPITFIHGDLRDGLPPAKGQTAARMNADGYDLIVSNPPYVPSATASDLLSDGRGEPILALDGGEDGLDLVRPLVDNVRKALAPGGILLIETGEYNARAAAACMSERGFAEVTVHQDLAGQDRVVEGTLQ